LSNTHDCLRTGSPQAVSYLPFVSNDLHEAKEIVARVLGSPKADFRTVNLPCQPSARPECCGPDFGVGSSGNDEREGNHGSASIGGRISVATWTIM